MTHQRGRSEERMASSHWSSGDTELALCLMSLYLRSGCRIKCVTVGETFLIGMEVYYSES